MTVFVGLRQRVDKDIEFEFFMRQDEMVEKELVDAKAILLP